MWQSYFEMMHVVPSCASPVPYFSPSYSPESPPDLTFEFDLNLLPSADCSDVVPGLDLPLPLSSDPFQEVPSPSSSLDSYLHSPTMFSPAGNEKTPLYSSYMMDPNSSSPISLPPSSPYSPAGRPNRLSSTDSGRMTSEGSGCSIQDSMLELNELRSHLSRPPPPYSMPQGLIVPKTEPQASNDHPLLRQVLEDFSFEPKFEDHFDFRAEIKSELDQSLSNVKMDPVISLAMEQVNKDIETTCQILHISPNPSCWSRNDVMRWLEWTMQQFNILPSQPIHQWAAEGHALVQLSESQFKDKFPQGGDLMYAQLDVWRSNANCNQEPSVPQEQQQQQSMSQHFGSLVQSNETQFDPRINLIDLMSIMDDASEDRTFIQDRQTSFDDQTSFTHSRSFENIPSRNEYLLSPPPAYPGTPASNMASSNNDFSMEDDDEEVPSEPEVILPTTVTVSNSPVPHTPPTPTRTSSNIHLWQFVKELLNEPHLHSGCIHWVDREKGIFKIVDSVRVAHLWGKRKNRPAMNYDKLSRSLRQYYKKGIMKKTERTQRLVYQFCPPYHL